jgi:hypothetical protein
VKIEKNIIVSTEVVNTFHFLFDAAQWGCTTGNAATVAHSTKKQQAEKIP